MRSIPLKKAMQAIQELDFGEDTCSINQYIKKRMQNNDISEIINMERQDISLAMFHTLQNSQPASASAENCLPRTEILRSRMCDIT